MVHQDLVNLLLAHVLDLSSVNDSGLGLSGVDILDLDSLPGGNILNGFGSLRDDSDRSGDGSGSDGMVTSDLFIEKTNITNNQFSPTILTMMTLIPADLHLATASGTAALGGSIIDIRPTNLRPSRGKLTSSASKGYPLGYLSAGSM